ncbi:sugar phosphate isomerase/epimerase [Paenibacillus sp. R14(2021)]|uniref:sugar phosphate isomerase/epimerase family protein n=1 Tax=Paenibacillus sp. R14(2021) TaxID=2859228 RepID=UPI001C61469D|nr:sugar phosphate isomerase/epimerase family protein [Paenibacillus sp. R14(2021)]
MKIATQDKPFFPEQVEAKLAAVQAMGFDAYEIDGKLLIDEFEAVKRAIRTLGIEVPTACGGYRGWIGDFNAERREHSITDIGEILKHLAEISGKGIVVPAAWGMFSRRLPPHTPPRSDEETRAVLLDSLGRINRVAEQTGTYLYLEPLNRYEDYMINSLSDAVSLIEEGGFSRVQVIADFFHMNIEERNIAASLKAARKHLGHVHLADSHRFQPGDGHMDFVSGFRALKEIGYDDYLAFECRVQGEDEASIYRASVNYIRACLRQAEQSN